MKIDLHCHTKKCKKGDSKNRDVDCKTFIKVLSDNDVKIVAITNHNHFCLSQYEEFKKAGEEKGIQVWPGVEVDVEFNGEKGHCLFISDPKVSVTFDSLIKDIVRDTSPDDLCVDFKTVVKKLKEITVIIIAHLDREKKPGFSRETCKKMSKIVKNNLFLMEASNIKSVGIMYANNIDGIVGSDVKDWNNYNSEKVPELKLPVCSFDRFLCLLKKDPQAIKTFLDQKKEHVIEIEPFKDEKDHTKIKIPLREDVNVIFGGKGTGKTKILEALKKELILKFSEKKVVYYAGSNTTENYDRLVNKSFNDKYFDELGVESNKNNFDFIKKWELPTIPSMNNFYKGHIDQKNNAYVEKFGFSNTRFSSSIDENEKNKALEAYVRIRDAVNTIKAEDINLYFNDSEEIKQLFIYLDKLLASAKQKYKDEFAKLHSLKLYKFTITAMQNIMKTKKGVNSIPASTGFADFFINHLNIYRSSKEICNLIKSKTKVIKKNIGDIHKKGRVFVEITISLDPWIPGLKYGNLKIRQRNLQNIFNDINEINKNSFDSKLQTYINKYVNDEGNLINSLNDFMGVKFEDKICREDGTEEIYTPSSGEKSMLLLSNALINENYFAYILDEPELSLGHKYINEYIVPTLNKLAKLNKLIVVSTHDANIAIRTCPLTTIYRDYKKTYIGNLFIDQLIESDEKHCLSRTETSMDHLEGGELAFKERKEKYGI